MPGVPEASSFRRLPVGLDFERRAQQILSVGVRKKRIRERGPLFPCGLGLSHIKEKQ